MPYSSEAFKGEVIYHILSNIKPDYKVLDVGAGAGRYGIALQDYVYIDAVEIYEPYIEKFNLQIGRAHV